MVRDLNFPVRICVSPTVRERDGLALSSRNAYLDPAQRRQATVLRRALRLAARAVREAKRPIRARRLKRRLTDLVSREPAARVDYVEVFDPDTLEPVALARPGVHLALAVFVGRTRLIDNTRL
jgi:pantoate--beta-alanine ligase